MPGILLYLQYEFLLRSGLGVSLGSAAGVKHIRVASRRRQRRLDTEIPESICPPTTNLASQEPSFAAQARLVLHVLDECGGRKWLIDNLRKMAPENSCGLSFRTQSGTSFTRQELCKLQERQESIVSARPARHKCWIPKRTAS